MMGEWRTVSLWEVADYVNGRPTKPTELCGDYGVPVIKIAELNRGITDQTDRIPPELVDPKHWVRDGDLLFAWSGSVGIYRYRGPKAALNQHVFKVIAKSGIDQNFLQYILLAQLPAFQRKVEDKKTTMGHVTVRDLQGTLVDVPPLCEQRAIAHILGTLDDKIELNRKMSETLEAMARALFKSWFADFEPVRAKMEGRWRHGESLPGLPAHLYDLFPARLVPSELGPIPEGWEVKSIGDLAEVVGGNTPKTERAEYWEGGTHHWVTPKDLSGLLVPVLLDTERKITDAGLAQISSGLLPKGTVLLSSRAPIGYLAIAEVPVAINQGFIAMKPRCGTSNLFLLQWARAAHDEIVSHANGSTFLEISKSSFRAIRIVAPTTAVMHAFDRLTRPMYLKVVEQERECRTLAALRNALLPKLVRGEIRVEEAGRFLEERELWTEHRSPM